MKRSGLLHGSRILCTVFVLMMAVLSFMAGCGSSGGGGSAPPVTPGGSPGTTGMIMGTVKDTAGVSIANATVTAVGTGLTATTNDQGYYSMSGLAAATRLTVNYSSAGYAPTSKITAIQANQSSYLDAVIAAVDATATFPASSGTTVTTTGGAIGTLSGGAVTIPANALVDGTGANFAGTATITVTASDPTTTSGRNAFPGDFEGVQAAGGATVPIESYGFIDVNITDASGNKLQLATGQTATITIPIPSSMRATAPATIPLWYYDTATGQWKEQGTATKSVAGDVFTGTVSHFTTWNADVPISQKSTVTGRVVDGSGNPIQGARVEVRPTETGRGWSGNEASTSADGTFSIVVMAASNCQIWATKNGIESDHKSFISAAGGGTVSVGDIVLAEPLIKITLTWGLDPRDLDSHLTVPMADGSRAHVYYSNQAPTGADAYLDTDDTTSYGPEIITVSALHNGIYRYSVHHYAGDGTISSSRASVSMFVKGFGIYNLTPPAGATAVDDVWQLWEITVSGGVVTAVTPLNKFIAGVSADAVTAPAFKGAPKPALHGGNW
jgi:hypothetical protein